ncbi:hypothetical protein GCM10009641_37860 [Mycobacterium cookii]|uniref:Uncharacterized protein n=1 Tax=Nocardioides furvisabuli TaxID=375542 RepID=A0ABN2X4Y7_9ACTN|nr:hypothetical protein [Nocardioides furvisabuli]
MTDGLTTRRGAAVLALLLAVGLVGGFGASWALGELPRGDGAPTPVVAASPSLPVDPVPDILPDPAYPPLEPGARLVTGEVGSGGSRMTLPVPQGWTFSENSLDEWQWRPPDQQSFGQVMRVEQVLSNRRSISWTLERRIDELDEDEQNVTILERTDDSLHFTFVTSNHLRHGFLTWLDVTGSDDAQVEIAVTGRARDADGMADLISRVAAGVSLG